MVLTAHKVTEHLDGPGSVDKKVSESADLDTVEDFVIDIGNDGSMDEVHFHCQ